MWRARLRTRVCVARHAPCTRPRRNWDVIDSPSGAPGDYNFTQRAMTGWNGASWSARARLFARSIRELRPTSRFEPARRWITRVSSFFPRVFSRYFPSTPLRRVTKYVLGFSLLFRESIHNVSTFWISFQPETNVFNAVYEWILRLHWNNEAAAQSRGISIEIIKWCPSAWIYPYIRYIAILIRLLIEFAKCMVDFRTFAMTKHVWN